MKVIHYTCCFRALNNYVKAYNDSKEKLTDQLRQNTVATARDLIRIYGAQLARRSDFEVIDPHKLPGLSTNNVELASMSHASPRTIHRHVKRLQSAGIITKKVWHGSRANYELWINPRILLVNEKKGVDSAGNVVYGTSKKDAQNSDEDGVLVESRSKCLHTDASNNRYTNNIIIAVDKSGTSQKIAPQVEEKNKRCSLPLTGQVDETGYTTGNATTGYTGEKDAKKSKDAGEKGGKKRAGATKQDTARAASLNLYASMLWMLAKKLLYANVYLTERQEAIAVELLKGWYAPVKTASLAKIHQIYVERISLVRKYLEKDPEKRYVQLPYRYFDTGNPHGFTGTKKWHQQHQKRKKQVQEKLILSAQIRRYRENLSKPPDRQRSPIALYRECELRVSSLQNPALLERFHTAILQKPIHQQFYA